MPDDTLPLPAFRDQVVFELARSARRERLSADRLEFDAVLEGRVAGWSWERLSKALDRPQETLRRVYSARVTARLQDRDTPATRR